MLYCGTFSAANEQKCCTVARFWWQTSKSVVLSHVFGGKGAKHAVLSHVFAVTTARNKNEHIKPTWVCESWQPGPSWQSCQVNVSTHNCYRTMWDYLSLATAKKPADHLDHEAFQSDGHPAVDELSAPSSNLQKAWAARGAKVSSAEGDTGKPRRFGVLEFYDSVRALPTCSSPHHGEEMVWQEAQRLDASGDRALLHFMLARRDLPVLLAKVRRAGQSGEALRRDTLSRLEVLREALVVVFVFVVHVFVFQCSCHDFLFAGSCFWHLLVSHSWPVALGCGRCDAEEWLH